MKKKGNVNLFGRIDKRKNSQTEDDEDASSQRRLVEDDGGSSLQDAQHGHENQEVDGGSPSLDRQQVKDDGLQEEAEAEAEEEEEEEEETEGRLRKKQSDESTVVDLDNEQVNMLQVENIERDDAELNSFWKDHDTWKQKAAAAPIKVELRDPQQASRTLLNPNPPVLFQVVTDGIQGNVRRRYSDFEWLRDILRKRYIGMTTPGLPEKRIVHTDNFLQERMKALNLFMDKVVLNPYFRYDSTVKSFLTVADPAQWDGLKKSTAVMKPGTMLDQVNENTGLKRWHEALHAYKVPGNEAQAILKMDGQLNVLEEMLKRLVSSADKLLVSASAYSAALKDLSDQIPKSQEILNSSQAPIQNVLIEMGNAFSSWSATCKEYPDILDQNLVSYLREELEHVQDIQRLLRLRDTISANIAKAQHQIMKLESEKEAVERTGRLDRVPKVMEKIAQAIRTKQLNEKNVRNLTKGIFYTEVDMFVENQVKQFQQLLSCIAHAQTEHFVALQQVFSNMRDK